MPPNESERRRRRAESKLAKLYDEGEKAKGGNPNLTPQRNGGVASLKDLGTTSQEMAEYRRLAGVPDQRGPTLTDLGTNRRRRRGVSLIRLLVGAADQ
jgi:hypothetical protein